jgi:hypothetical protein
MWFLGAGASRSAGIKTAGDIIWDFKQSLYRSQNKLAPSSITDPGDPTVRQKLQQYFDDLGSYPAAGAEDEYAGYFEATYPSASDRRAYLDNLITQGKPSYGHLALALLMQENCCRILWTTNFDKTVEDAAAKVFGTTNRLVVADLGEPKKLTAALNEKRFPIYGKIHGDYHSVALKNTDDELREQDADMRRAFISACKSNGLAVVGYSGRDASVMDAMREGLDEGRGFPNGLFWFKRSGEVPFKAVTDLIDEARHLGIDAHTIDNETFDELMSDIVRFLPATTDKLSVIQGAKPPRLAKVPLKGVGAKTPTIRTNALPIISHPMMCRQVDCNIGGYVDVQEAIKNAGVDIVAGRIREGVIAFGRDVDIRTAFEAFDIKNYDTRPIADKNLMRETGERGLIRDALMRALSNRPNIQLIRRGRRILALPNLETVAATDFAEGAIKPISSLSGVVGKTSIKWTECCELKLDYQLDRLWLLMMPSVHRDVPEDASEDDIAQSREFVRKRLTARYNPAVNAVISGWSRLLAGTDRTTTLRSFGISDGVDATFEVSSVTGFSGVLR